MTWLLLGLILFLGVHLLPVAQGARNGLLNGLGEGPYKLMFSLASAVGLVLIIWGFGVARLETTQLWVPPDWTRHVAFLLMVPASILLAAAYIPSNIKRLAKHPMLAAIKIWAFSHLLANGDTASLLLFGTFLAYAVVDRISVQRRPAATASAATVSAGWSGDVAAIAIGIVFYAIMLFWGHGALIGIALTA